MENVTIRKLRKNYDSDLSYTSSSPQESFVRSVQITTSKNLTKSEMDEYLLDDLKQQVEDLKKELQNIKAENSKLKKIIEDHYGTNTQSYKSPLQLAKIQCKVANKFFSTPRHRHVINQIPRSSCYFPITNNKSYVSMPKRFFQTPVAKTICNQRLTENNNKELDLATIVSDTNVENNNDKVCTFHNEILEAQSTCKKCNISNKTKRQRNEQGENYNSR